MLKEQRHLPQSQCQASPTIRQRLGRQQRESDTLQMQAMVRGMDQKRLKYADLVA